MLKKIFFIAALASLAACDSGKKGAISYNQDLIKKEKSLQPEVITTEDNVKRYYAAQQFDSIAIAGERMEGIVQQKIDEINAMAPPKAKGVDDFKAAVIQYFKFIKNLYTDYKDFGKAETEEKRQGILNEIQKIVAQKQEALDDMQTAQRKYAEQNGFKLEAKPD